MTDYWTDTAADALCDAGIEATDEQIQIVAGWIESAHEFYGQAHGHDVASANLVASREREEQRLKDEMKRERAKVTCKQCNGTGVEVSHGPYHSAVSQCWKCKGDGRHD